MTDKTEPKSTEPTTEPLQPWWKKGAIDLWDKRLLIPSLVVGLAVYAWCSYQVKIHTPPVGYVYEELEPVTGVYKCCESGNRSSNSWVGNVHARCVPPAYYWGNQYADCGFKKELNGKVVTIKRIWYATSGGQTSVVRELSADGRVYFHYTDQKIREMWIFGSEGDAQTNALRAFLVAYLISYFICSHKLKNKGDKK